ncbi:MAG TPA: RDD family protein [Acidimicrobiales bacterium]|nr:RDD family protein [Acidimicrobiales bacterium]
MNRGSYIPPGVDVPLAGWGTRALGAILDGVIVGIPTYLIALAAAIRGRTGYLYLELATSFVYSFGLIAFWGRTLGMAALRLDAVDAVDGHLPIGPVRAAVRSLTAGVLTVFLIGAVVDLLWPLWDARNQTLHDKAAGTVVLRRYG